MKRLVFATGNPLKLKLAQYAAQGYNVEIIQKPLNVEEIQSEDPEKIALDKAAKAFAILGEPLFITDDSWSFPGLNGFPGGYMHSMNVWLSPEDFLRLTLPLKDRRVILIQTLVYRDKNGPKKFKNHTEGQLLKQIRGTSPDHSNHTIITMPGDNGLSLAEVYQHNQPIAKDRPVGKVWQDFFEWISRQ